MLANIIFRSDIDRHLANDLLNKAQYLSYRQICILSLVVRRDEFSISIGRAHHIRQDDVKFSSILVDIYDLIQQGIIEDDPIDRRGSVSVGYELAMGRLLFDLMGLEDIDATELEEIAVYLRSKENEKSIEGSEEAPTS